MTISREEWNGRILELSFSGITLLPQPVAIGGPRLIIATATAGGSFLGPPSLVSPTSWFKPIRMGYYCSIWNKGATTFTLTDVDLQVTEVMAQDAFADLYITRVSHKISSGAQMKFYACMSTVIGKSP